MLKKIIVAGLGLFITLLFAADIKDGNLYLEMMFVKNKQIKIETAQNSSIEVREVLNPLGKTYFSNLTLEPYAVDGEIRYGIINRSEPADSSLLYDDEDGQINCKFVWESGKLDLRYEKLIFEDKYFSSREAAEKYASETGYPLKLIRTIPMQNARIKVTTDKGETDYFQLPVQIKTASAVKINGIDCGDDLQCCHIKRSDSSLLVTFNLNIENYLINVLPYEIGDTAPEEALKAQAVAARTHAINLLLQNRHAGDGFDLCNTTHCQVYKFGLKHFPQVEEAVNETRGVVMEYDSLIADGVYHSNCGGKTESNQNAWSGKPIPYLQGVACYPETDSLDLTKEANAVKWINTTRTTEGMANWERRSEKWEQTITKSALEQNTGGQNLQALTVLKRGVSGRILKLKLSGSNDIILDGEYQIRQAFGGLPSSFFYLKNGANQPNSTYILDDTIKIIGKGYGHGVGMCQVGALQKARSGWTWQQILSNYFPGVTFYSDWLNQPVQDIEQRN